MVECGCGVVTPTDEQRAEWAAQAMARWRHLPPGPDRDARVARTYAAIEREADEVSVHLPELTDAEADNLWLEALLDAALDVCGEDRDPTPDEAPAVVDLALCLWRTLQARARLAKDPGAAARLARRRFMRRVMRHLEHED